MFGKKEILYPLVIDISENRVTVVDYTIDRKTGNTLIRGVGDVKLPFGVVSTDAIDQESFLTKSVSSAIAQVRTESRHKDDISAVIGVSGPLLEVKNRTIEVSREKPKQKIKHKEWMQIINDVYTQFDSEVYINSQGHNLPLSLVQVSLNNILLDEEEVVDPILKQANLIKLETLNTYIPANYKNALIHIAKSNNFHIDGVYQVGSAVGQLVLDYNTSKDLSVILIDIKFGQTSISVIQNQKIIYAQSFSMGSHSFTQAIANAFQITIDEAETVRKEYNLLQLPRDMARRITESLESEVSLWLQGVVLSLQELNLPMLPPYIFIYGEGADLVGIKEVLEYGGWYKLLNIITKPHISILTPKQFPHMVDMTSTINSSKYLDILGLIHIASIPMEVHLPYRISE